MIEKLDFAPLNEHTNCITITSYWSHYENYDRKSLRVQVFQQIGPRRINLLINKASIKITSDDQYAELFAMVRSQYPSADLICKTFNHSSCPIYNYINNINPSCISYSYYVESDDSTYVEVVHGRGITLESALSLMLDHGERSLPLLIINNRSQLKITIDESEVIKYLLSMDNA